MGDVDVVRIRNRDAPVLYAIIGVALLVPAVAGALTPQRWQVLGVLVVTVGLLARYLLPVSCDIRRDSILFRWPLRHVEVSTGKLARAQVVNGGTPVVGLRARGSVRFGVRPSRWSDPALLRAALERIVSDAPPETIRDHATVLAAVRRL